MAEEKKYLDKAGLRYLWGKITALIHPFTGAENGKDGTQGEVPAPKSATQDYNKFLKGDGTWATPTQQNLFDKVKVGTSTISADSTSDTLTFEAGENITLTPDVNNDKITIKATNTNTTYTLTQDATDGHKLIFTPSSGNEVEITIPDNDTTYSSLAAASDGTAVSLVTTGEKYTWNNKTSTVPAAYCSTAAGTAAKTATHTGYTLKPNSYEFVTIVNSNTAASKLTLSINGKTAKNIYIDGVISSSSNATNLVAGTYLVFYDGTNYYFRTDNKITASITGDAATVNGHAVNVDVPADAKFTDTTYSSLAAAQNGTAVSLVTTGEKYNWNNKASTSLASSSANGLMSSSDYNFLHGTGTTSLSGTYATKTQLSTAVSGLFKYKGSAQTADGLPSNPVEGDVWNIVSVSSYGGPGTNVVYTLNGWDSLGSTFVIATLEDSDIDDACQ